jgi:hypothetical protein
MAVTRIQLNPNTYVDLGAAPCTVQLENSNRPVYIVANTAIPANTVIGIKIEVNNGGVADVGSSYAGSNVFARAVNSSNTYVIVMRP